MTSASSSLDTAPRPERRQDVRTSFAPSRRPILRLPDGVYPVLDMSLRGLRIRHFDPVRPPFGGILAGTLQPPDERPPVPVRGLIVRVQAADVAIQCDEGTLPIGWILEEVARANDEAPATDQPAHGPNAPPTS